MHSTYMALRLTFLLFLLAVASSARASRNGPVGLARLSNEDDIMGPASWGNCDGTVGDCVSEDEEMGMESGTTRRGLLRNVHFISYGALARDRVPCNRRGHSYYNCQQRGRANPYRRGCSVITRCARFLH